METLILSLISKDQTIEHGNPNLITNKYGPNEQTWKPYLRLGFPCLIFWSLVLGILFSKLLAPPDPTQPNLDHGNMYLLRGEELVN
jgi:hypothetical protein